MIASSVAAALGITLNLAKFKLIIASILGLASKVLLGPASASIPVLLYYDHKVRYENFSIEQSLIKEKKKSNACCE